MNKKIRPSATAIIAIGLLITLFINIVAGLLVVGGGIVFELAMQERE